MKKPTKEDFLTAFNSTTTEIKSDKYQQLADKFNVSTRTIYFWLEEFRNEVESDVPQEPVSEKNFLDWMVDYHEELPQQKMLEHTITMKGNPLIICVSDLHIGSRYLFRERLAEDVKEWLKHDDIYILIMGDLIDYGPDGPKDLISEQQLLYQTQRKVALSLADTIGHKTLAICSGCHSHFDLDGVPVEEEFAKKTYTKIFLHDGGILNINCGDQTYKIFMTHKTRGGSYVNPARALMKLNENDLDFDIGIEAHRHSANIDVSVKRQKPVVAINCGTYKGMDSFANRKGFFTKPIFIPAFRLFSTKHVAIPYLDWRDGL
jgi:hypothetical protein